MHNSRARAAKYFVVPVPQVLETSTSPLRENQTFQAFGKKKIKGTLQKFPEPFPSPFVELRWRLVSYACEGNEYFGETESFFPLGASSILDILLPCTSGTDFLQPWKTEIFKSDTRRSRIDS